MTGDQSECSEPDQPQPEVHRALIFVSGRVQGVGFRWWTRSRALELGLVGHARNMSDGRVEISAQGTRADIGRLIEMLMEKPSSRSRPGQVTTVVPQWHPPREGLTSFVER